MEAFAHDGRGWSAGRVLVSALIPSLLLVSSLLSDPRLISSHRFFCLLLFSSGPCIRYGKDFRRSVEPTTPSFFLTFSLAYGFHRLCQPQHQNLLPVPGRDTVPLCGGPDHFSERNRCWRRVDLVVLGSDWHWQCRRFKKCDRDTVAHCRPGAGFSLSGFLHVFCCVRLTYPLSFSALILHTRCGGWCPCCVFSLDICATRLKWKTRSIEALLIATPRATRRLAACAHHGQTLPTALRSLSSV